METKSLLNSIKTIIKFAKDALNRGDESEVRDSLELIRNEIDRSLARGK